MTSFKTRKSDGQVFPTDRKTSRDSGNPNYVGVDKTQISRPKNLFGKKRDVDNPYEIWDSPDGSFELRVLKKNQIDDDKPYATWFTAVKSPATFGSWEYGDQYVKDIKSGYAKRQSDAKQMKVKIGQTYYLNNDYWKVVDKDMHGNKGSVLMKNKRGETFEVMDDELKSK